MQSTFNLDQLIPLDVSKTVYHTIQQGKGLFGLIHKTLNYELTNLVIPNWKQRTEKLSQEEREAIRQQREKLLEIDWKEAQTGVYPFNLLFEDSWQDFWLYPAVWLDLPNSWQKIQEKRYQDFSDHINQDIYPSYYLQNFHYQTDGYLSDWSASLYDLQVELLFQGTANPMRRRIIKPLKVGLRKFKKIQEIRLLDVACGTGNTLKMLRFAMPKISLFGVDLSAAYLRKANQNLSQITGELPQLSQANAENLPYKDNYFHAVTSVFLFHELPPQARQNVIQECFRVIQPGGIFIICDSIQAIDSPEFKTSMDNFPKLFHEPYYQHYINDDLVTRLTKAGFDNISTKNHFMSKYWLAHKPV